MAGGYTIISKLFTIIKYWTKGIFLREEVVRLKTREGESEGYTATSMTMKHEQTGYKETINLE